MQLNATRCSAWQLSQRTRSVALALPLFLLFAAVGGIIGWLVTRLGNPPPAALWSLAIAPLVLGVLENNHTELPQDYLVSRAEITIDAPAHRAWYFINNAVDIQRHEMAGGLAYRIGVPYPLEARTVKVGTRRMRNLKWEKGITFSEIITEWRANEVIRWQYVFDETSIPPGALDDHVRIGGAPFDLTESSYILTEIDGGTRLALEVRYRVSTNFNWYARFWARLLI